MKINNIYQGDSLEVLKEFDDNSIDTIITDPPYGLSFMGKKWDYDVPSVELWQECLRVLKPGGTALIFAGSRTQHRMAVNVEDAGFELKDCIMWLYGSGFPKASDVAKNISKQIDKQKEKLYNSNIWNTQSNNAKSAKKIYLNELIEAGLLTTSKDFVVENVTEFLKSKQLNVGVSFAEKNLEDLNHTSGDIFIVPENVEVKTKQQLSTVPIVELKGEDPNAPLKATIIFVPFNVRTFLCEKVENKIKEDAVQKTESGNKKSLKETDINAECAELIENLKLITLYRLKIIQNYATTLRTEKLTATNVIITKSIKECLTLSTVDIVGYKEPFGREGRKTKGKAKFESEGWETETNVPVEEHLTPEAQLWNGWKSHGLKPAYEPILVAMKPNDGTYANNALKHGVSGLNIDGGRIEGGSWLRPTTADITGGNYGNSKGELPQPRENNKGRFPANIILECICDEVVEGREETKEPEEVSGGIFSPSTGKPAGRTYKGTGNIHTNPDCPCYMLDKQSGVLKSGALKPYKQQNRDSYSGSMPEVRDVNSVANKGGASRFFYCAKSSKAERNAGCEGLGDKKPHTTYAGDDWSLEHLGNTPANYRKPVKNNHPTVKPLALMEYLCKLTMTPTGGIVIDPFAGSGTTLIACKKLGRPYIGIEREKEYIEIAEARLNAVPKTLF